MQKELEKIGPEHPDLRQWASFIIGSAAGDTVGGVTAYYGTKHNNENTGLDLVTSIAVYGAGLKVSGDIIKDRITGKVLATWDAEAGGFVSGYGDYLGINIRM